MIDMRIATWNLARARPGSRRAGLLQEYMAAVEADIWVLTETWKELSPGPGYECVTVSCPAGDRESAGGECWVAVWAKSSLRGEPLITADPERTAAMRIDLFCHPPLVVFGTVLPWLSDARAPKGLRGATAFLSALDMQYADWNRLRAAIPGAALCVAGDFNQDLVDWHYYGSARGKTALRTVLELSGLTCLTAGTADPLARYRGRASIDHICVSSELEGMVPRLMSWPALEEVGPKLTDHFGVVADLSGS
jgi:hypothetical protein